MQSNCNYRCNMLVFHHLRFITVIASHRIASHRNLKYQAKNLNVSANKRQKAEHTHTQT